MDAAAAPSETSKAVLESVLIPAGAYCFEFYYYMNGEDVGGELTNTSSINFFATRFHVIVFNLLVANEIFFTVLLIVLWQYSLIVSIC